MSGTESPNNTIEAGIEGMSRTRLNKNNFLALAAIFLAATGCSSKQSADKASVDIRGSALTNAPVATLGAAPAATVNATPDASGIVSYDGYQAAVARSGDTVASVAQRIGLSASELGAYNGLSPTHPLRQGDELVLPQRPAGTDDWSEEKLAELVTRDSLIGTQRDLKG